MVIAAQQGQAAPSGFTDPACYKLAGTAAFFPTLPLTNRSPALDSERTWRFIISDQ
jgi:hypothetical protein